MSFVKLSVLLATFSMTLSCSAVQNLAAKKDDKKDSSATATTPAKAADPASDPAACTTGANCAAPKADEPLDEETKLGLADFCTDAKNDKGETCFTCTPRDLPNTKCAKFDADFSPATACKHDFDQMSCAVTGAADFVYDFGEMSKEEKIYSKIPILIFGAKALLAGKLKDKPEIKDLLFGALDTFDKYKKEIFTDGNVDPYIEELSDLVKKADPTIDATKFEDMKKAFKSAVTALQAARKSGKLQDTTILTAANDILSALPEELVGQYLEGFDLGKITEALKGGGGDEMISQLVALLGGGQSIDDILKSLEGG